MLMCIQFNKMLIKYLDIVSMVCVCFFTKISAKTRLYEIQIFFPNSFHIHILLQNSQMYTFISQTNMLFRNILNRKHLII